MQNRPAEERADMNERKHEDEKSQTNDKSKSAQQEASQNVSVQQNRDQSQELAKLRGKVADLQQQAVNSYPNEKRVLENYQQIKRQELEKVQTAAKPDASNAHAVEQQAE